MPEGHTIHREARLQRAGLGSGPIAASSPQGRFHTGAQQIDGRRIESIDAVGKHLLYRFEGRRYLHVHLGLVGRFAMYEVDPPPPSPNARLSLQGDATVYLMGPATCELLDPLQVKALVERLGPDPLDPDADAERFFADLARRATPIGATILDQSVIAGIGNVYRSELLFLTGIHPDRAAADLAAPEREALWKLAVDLLAEGERTGRIVTVAPREVGAARRSRLPKELHRYVYKRWHQPCRRCGTEIRRWELGGRLIWACPSCQPR
jgi:endonuclease-8